MTRFKHLIIASLALALLSIGFVYFSNPPSHSVMSDLRSKGDVLVKRIEEYRKTNRGYPESLNQIGIDKNKKHYGGWEYTLENDGSSFVLSIGDYREYLFELFWDSNSGEWYLDR